MTRKRQLYYGTDHAGIEVRYYERADLLLIEGWYDTCVGIPGGGLSMGEFLVTMGITPDRCAKLIDKYKRDLKENAE